MGNIKKTLTIAGSDSGGCAGIQADIKTISACGVFAMSAITAVTSQNTLGVTYIQELSEKSISSQIDAVLSDIGADSVKSGMLSSKTIIETVAARLKDYNIVNYILDPVMVSTSGAALLKSDSIDSLINKLIPLALIVTPNIPEAEILTGMKIKTQDDIDKACRYIAQMGAKNVLIKGGHMESKNATDTLFDGNKFTEYTCPKVDTKNTHGTGCSYASAIAAYIAKGYDMNSAVQSAKQYITNAISAGAKLSIGKGSGPIHHFYNIPE